MCRCNLYDFFVRLAMYIATRMVDNGNQITCICLFAEGTNKYSCETNENNFNKQYHRNSYIERINRFQLIRYTIYTKALR